MDKKPLSRTAQYYSKVPITKRHGGNFDIFELISKYRDYECLWNYKCLDYKNKRAKQRCWIRIARYFNTEVELVKSKMKNLRAAYLMEKKKVQKSLLAGGTPYTPNLFYYKYLSFLDDVVVLRHDLEKIDIIEHNTNDASQQGMEDEDGDEYDDIIKTEYKMETEHKMERNIQNTIDVVELIAKYKEQRCLWDCTCEDYKNLNMKQDAWESIGDSMGFEASDIKTKVKNLRSAYLLEKKKVLAAKLKGTSHIPKLFYYKNLDFLETVMVFRKAPEKDATLESTNDYKRTSASEFESDEKDQYDVEPLIKLEDNFPEILPAATGQKPHIDVYELIEKYKHYECLWNIRNKDYKNSKIRENCWSVIARHFGVEVSAVKSKVKNLRSAYVAEKKKVDKSKLLGGRPHKPYLFYYNKLTFLDKMVVMRKTADDEPILNRSNNTEQVIDFENTTSTTNDHESKNSFDESNVFEFENVDITQDGEDKAEIEHFNKSEDVELELPTIPEYSKNVSPEPTTSKVTSTRSPATRQHNKRKSKRKSKLHSAVNDIERVNVYNSFGKTIALQLKQLSLNVASVTMLEVHSILTKKVLEHYRSSQNDDDDDNDSQSSSSNDEDCVDDILQAAINDANI